MTRTLFTGGTVVSATGSLRADVLVVDEAVAAVGNLSQLATTMDVDVVDVGGRLLLPGGVDVHTHLDSGLNGPKTADDFESGTIAAAAGGTTTLVDFAAQAPGLGLMDSLAAHADKARGKAVVDYGFHMCVSDLYDGAMADFADVVASGVTSFKVFMAYRGTLMLDDGQLFDVLRRAGSLGAQVCVHAENGDVIDRLAADLVAAGTTGPRGHLLSRPPKTEVEAVRRAIAIADMASAPIYLVHVSTAGAVEAVAAARRNGGAVAAETCTHYLTLDPEMYEAPGFEGGKVVLTPPLRSEEHRDALWDGLGLGDLSVVSSDHCPYCLVDKERYGKDDFRQIPNGGPGVEHRLPVLYGQGVATGRLGIERFVELTATAPAKQFGLYPRKGVIAAGSDADLVVLDPDGETRISADTQHQRMDYTPWEGWVLSGRITQVWSRGERIVEDGRYVGAPGRGRFLARSAVS
ncbi:dihydropyrimidinase [Phytohabitans sp. ZYX-F-186]|uniref:Dihydropyrimidinase n=1 Tax=Phytohabitans maris TaxID=3071409 RepID=A0ABU0ZPC9_9ACTN|nr:dihydropyrimidinase [Phytohabitans sp. ZYX-F-186]MDQ7908877.1 dihydropyrimidinase [Phytohabitans sp. ZYX-F-186]